MTDIAKEQTPSVWKRGGSALLLMIAFEVSRTVLWIIAVVQFGWEAVAGEKNTLLQEFGGSLANWQQGVTRFVSGATEERPFPWAAWPAAD